MHSLIYALPWAALALLVAAPSVAQERTPTNPLDVPAPAPSPDGVPPVPMPDAPSSPRLALPPRADVVVPSLGEAPPPLEDLLPASVRQPGGMSEAQVVARARRRAVPGAIAQAQRRAAEAGVTAAQLSFMPNVSFSARYTRLSDITPGTIGFFNTPACLQDIPACQNDPGAFQQDVVLQEPILNQYSFVGSARWNITDLIGAKRHDLKAAEAEADAARANAQATDIDLAFEAIVAYWDVVRARAQAELARESLAAAEELARDAASRRAQGVATELEVLQLRGNVLGYARLVRVADSRVELAESSLRHLLGLEASAPVAVDAELTVLPTPPSDSAASMARGARDRSPAIAAARARAEAADARASSREARLYPSLTTSFNLNYDNPNQRIFPQEEKFIATWDASLQLSWSLDGTIIGAAQVHQLREIAAAERLAVERAEQGVTQAVIAARGNLEAALLGVESAHHTAGAAEVAARQARERAAVGMATGAATMRSDAESLSARLDLVDALVDARVAAADLDRAVSAARDGDR